MGTYREAGKLILFDKLSVKWIFTMCSAEGSAHVPTFSKKKLLFTFLQSSMLKSITGNMGVQNSVIFSLHGTGKCNCQQKLTATVQQHAEFKS